MGSLSSARDATAGGPADRRTGGPADRRTGGDHHGDAIELLGRLDTKRIATNTGHVAVWA
jgi:hypothetical protein